MNNSFSRICNTALLRTGFLDSNNIYLAYDRLFLTLIDNKKYSSINLQTLCNDYNSFYKTNINTLFVKTFVQRLEKKSYLKKIDNDNYICKLDAIAKLGLSEQYSNLLNENNLLILDLVSFLKSIGETNCSEEDATTLLLDSINDNVSNLGNNHIEANNQKNKYIMFLYLNNLKQNDNHLFEIYKNIMYGRILSTFIEGNERYLSTNYNFFKNATFYLDSGFVFNLLGLNSNSNGSEYEDMIRTLQKLGAHIKIFDHIFHNEIESIIYKSIGYVENPMYKPSKSPNVTNYFVENGFTKIEVEEYYHGIERRLGNYGISIENYQIDYNEQDTVFEKNFYNGIIKDYSKTGKIDEDRDETYWNDAKSLFLIHKLRKGRTYTKLSDTAHVLLTTNAGIGRVANDFNNKEFNGNNTPYALTDLLLNTLLYISYGNYSEKTNERFAVPAAFHGFDPSKEWLVELDKQLDIAKEKGSLSDGEIISWKSSKFLLNELVKTTKGDPNYFDENTIEKTLLNYKAEADRMVDVIYTEANEKIEKVEEQLKREKANNLENAAILKDRIINSLEESVRNYKDQKTQLNNELISNMKAIKAKKNMCQVIITLLVAFIVIVSSYIYVALSNSTKYWITAIVLVVSTLFTNVLWACFTHKNADSPVMKVICKKNVARIEAIKDDIKRIDEKVEDIEEQLFSLKDGRTQ